MEFKGIELSPDVVVYPGQNIMMTTLPAALCTAEVFSLDHAARLRSLPLPGGDRISIAPWGASNCFPQDADKLLYQDRDAPTIIENKVNFLLGQGLQPVRRTYVDGRLKTVPVMSGPVFDFWQTWKRPLAKIYEAIGKNYESYGNAFIEFLFNRRQEVASARNSDCHFTRAAILQPGELKPSRYILSTTPHQAALHSAKYEVVPDIEYFNPAQNGFKYIHHLRRHQPGQPYYSFPVWIGAVRDMRLQSVVLDAQLASIENAWHIKYHMEVDSRYFDNCQTDAEKKAKKQELVRELNNVLEGTSAHSSTLITEMVRDHLGKYSGQVKISPIDSKSDDKLTKLAELKSQSQPRSFNIDPELAGIIAGTNLSSGSEIRNKYLLHVILKTPPVRSLLLEVVDIIHRSYRLDPAVEYEFKDYEITTLDAAPTGLQAL